MQLFLQKHQTELLCSPKFQELIDRITVPEGNYLNLSPLCPVNREPSPKPQAIPPPAVIGPRTVARTSAIG